MDETVDVSHMCDLLIWSLSKILTEFNLRPKVVVWLFNCNWCTRHIFAALSRVQTGLERPRILKTLQCVCVCLCVHTVWHHSYEEGTLQRRLRNRRPPGSGRSSCTHLWTFLQEGRNQHQSRSLSFVSQKIKHFLCKKARHKNPTHSLTHRHTHTYTNSLVMS